MVIGSPDDDLVVISSDEIDNKEEITDIDTLTDLIYGVPEYAKDIHKYLKQAEVRHVQISNISGFSPGDQLVERLKMGYCFLEIFVGDNIVMEGHKFMMRGSPPIPPLVGKP